MSGLKVTIKNLGPLQQAEFTTGQFTIICGENNTGKTYATYALYGFLKFWYDEFVLPVSKQEFEALINNGTLVIELEPLRQQAGKFLAEASALCSDSKRLARLLGGRDSAFSGAEVSVAATIPELDLERQHSVRLNVGDNHVASVFLERGASSIVVTLLAGREQLPPLPIVRNLIGDALKDIVFHAAIPSCFIISAERTGATIFRIDLDITRNRILETIASNSREGNKDFNILELLLKGVSGYALPVTENVNFIRELEKLKETGAIAGNHPWIIERLNRVVGGSFAIRDGILFFVPAANPRLRLGVNESSSSVRALAHLWFYINHLARPGDLLILDEPELTLHPINQRHMARLLATLSNLGVKVLITTHSDYITRELNTLLLLKSDAPRIQALRKRYNYHEDELLAAESLKLFIMKDELVKLEGKGRRKKIKTLCPSPVTQQEGMPVSTFDDSIDEMNRIQDDLVFGGDEYGN